MQPVAFLSIIAILNYTGILNVGIVGSDCSFRVPPSDAEWNPVVRFTPLAGAEYMFGMRLRDVHIESESIYAFSVLWEPTDRLLKLDTVLLYASHTNTHTP